MATKIDIGDIANEVPGYLTEAEACLYMGVDIEEFIALGLIYTKMYNINYLEFKRAVLGIS